MSDTAFTDTPLRGAGPSSTAVTATAPLPAPAGEPRPSADKKKPHPVVQALQVLASLRITVVLFVLSLALVYYGTWAQVDSSIWTVKRHYFHSYLVLIPLRVLTMRIIPSDIPIPYPGGYTLGSLLLINLLAAHIVRFKISWKRSGILLAHAGLVVMMIGEWIFGSFGLEGRMLIHKGNYSNIVEHDLYPEIAVVDRSERGKDKVTAIPNNFLYDGSTISSPDLPFDIHIDEFMKNSELDYDHPEKGKATEGKARALALVRLPEVSGASTEQRIDYASAYVTITDRATGNKLGKYLLSYYFDHLPSELQKVKGFDEFYISLRPKRSHRPFRVYLLDLKAEKHEDSETAKKYASTVRLVDDENSVDRTVTISMNDPLRYNGETYYQAEVLGPNTTGLQVVRNPGWLAPYYACAMVTLGLLIHFCINLVSFLQRRARA